MLFAEDLEPTKRGATDDFWWKPIGGAMSTAGVRVSPSTALAVSTFFACCLVLGQTVGMVPVHLYRRLKRGKERATSHPLYKLLHLRPNRWQTAFQFKQMLQWHLELRYNAYAEKIFDRMGNVVELIPRHPDRVEVQRIKGPDDTVIPRYKVTPVDGGEPRYLLRDEMLHLKGLTNDGIDGFSPLEVQGESLGEAIAAQRYSAARLRNNAMPGGVLEWEGHFANDEERNKHRASWQKAQTEINSGKVAVLERGMTWKDVGIKNTDLQYIELRKLKQYDICASKRMPPHKVGVMERATFTNIEHQGIEFATDTMAPHFKNWAEELALQLLPAEDVHYETGGLFFEFLDVALLRGDAKGRGEYYAKRFSLGSMSPNDIREAENENPVAGGDRYFVQGAYVPLDRVDDVVDKPAATPGGGFGGGSDKGDTEDEQTPRERELEEAAAARVVRKEVGALKRMHDNGTLAAEASGFYGGHVQFVAEVMVLEADVATDYCAQRDSAVQAAIAAKRVPEYLAELEANGVTELLEHVREHRPARVDLGGAVVELARAVAKQPAPVVNAGVTIAEGAVQVRHIAGDVNVEGAQVHVPAAEPVVKVENRIEAVQPDGPQDVRIVGMPIRESVSETERDRGGRIDRVKQTERDA